MRNFIAVLTFFSLLIVGGLVVVAQGYTLSISPTSGLPGTTVNLSPNPTYADERCFANGAQLGGRSYTVPAGASGTITFYCAAGTGEFYSETNQVTFTVIPPDSDGDGIPDSQDDCPNQAAATPNGCPYTDPNDPPPPPPPPSSSQPNTPVESQPQPPDDSDGDGVPDSADACPNSPASTPDGCAPRINLPVLPSDGPCTVATTGTDRVNVRRSVSINATIVAQLEPTSTYLVDAFGIMAQSDERVTSETPERWVNLSTGWVAERVIRMAGEDCDDIPIIELIDDDDDPIQPPGICPDRPLLVFFSDFEWRDIGDDRLPLSNVVSPHLPILFPYRVIGADGDVELVLQDDFSEYVDEWVEGRIYQGTDCPEIIVGSPNGEIINGMGNDDIIFGLGGNDTLLGGDGSDRILGGLGDDMILGNDGADDLEGGPDNDTIYANGGSGLTGEDAPHDRVQGDNGEDVIYGGPEADLIYGFKIGSYDGNLADVQDSDIIRAGSGSDRIYSGYGADLVSGGAGDDVIEVLCGPGYTGLYAIWEHAELVSGDEGDDLINLISVNGPHPNGDFCFADVLGVAPIVSEIRGGAGDDTIREVVQGFATSSSIQEVSDFLQQGSYRYYGDEGDDAIKGRNVIFGGPGDDNLHVMSFQNEDGIDLISSLGAHIVVGGAGNDTIHGGSEHDIILGGSGHDTILGWGDGDFIEGGSGDDRIFGYINCHDCDPRYSVDYLIGGPGNDEIVKKRWDIACRGDSEALANEECTRYDGWHFTANYHRHRVFEVLIERRLLHLAIIYNVDLTPLCPDSAHYC